MMERVVMVLVALLALHATGASFEMDRSVMSDRYWDIWNDDVQAKMDADIEKYRKADAAVEIDAPAGTEVEIEQVSHAFYFGAHIFNYNQLGKKEWNERHKELYGTLFNSATVAFYWRAFERQPFAPRFEERYEDTENFWNACPNPKEQVHWRRPPTDPVIDFLRTRGCRIHGHPLVWGSCLWHRPAWVWDDFCPENEKTALERKTGVTIPVFNWRRPVMPKNATGPDVPWLWADEWARVFNRLSEEEVAKTVPTFVANYDRFYEKRIRDIAERYGSRVDSWDVVNESANDYRWCQDERAVRGVACQRSRRYGIMPGDYAYKSFQWAQKCLPETARLNINENERGAHYVKQVKELISLGCRIDAVGSQMHLMNPGESVNIAQGEGPEHIRPDKIAEWFALLSQVGRPIHLSEVTVTAPDNSSRGQMVQAIILRNLYRAWFSVERMSGITWWNVVDDCGALGEPSISGLFTRDMRPKTAYFAMEDLVNREWKTRLQGMVEDVEGKRVVSFRGFRGRYRLTWKGANGKDHRKWIEVN